MLDLDDVVADWMGEAARFLQREMWKVGERIPNQEWNKLKLHHRFYRDLPLMPHAHKLVHWAKEFSDKNNMSLGFLTAIPHDNDMPWSIQDKVWWADKHFPGIPVFFGPYSHDKHLHCNPGDILIDDRISNCQDWVKAGGIAHQYTDWWKCEAWINSHLIGNLSNANQKSREESISRI